MGYPRVSLVRFDSSTLLKIHGREILGKFYRTVKDKHRSKTDSPIGSSRVDGRYHTAAEDEVLYLSETPTLCMNESTQVLKSVPLKDAAWHTATFVVELTKVLDLTSGKVLSSLGITPADLMQPRPGGYRLTQAVATASRVQGFEALLAPTARPGLSGNNLTAFLEVITRTGGMVKWIR